MSAAAWAERGVTDREQQTGAQLDEKMMGSDLDVRKEVN